MNSSKKQLKNGNIYLVIALIVVAILFYSSSQTYGQQSQVSRLESWLPNQPFKDTLAGIRFNYGGSIVSIDHLGYAKFVSSTALVAFLIARSTLSFGIFAAFALSTTSRRAGFMDGSGPPALAAI